MAQSRVDGETRGVRGLNLDITERRRAEEALRAAKERLEAIINALPDNMFVLERGGRILDSATGEATSVRTTGSMGSPAHPTTATPLPRRRC